MHEGRGKPTRWVFLECETGRKAKALCGEECQAVLLEESCDVCKYRVATGMDPAEDVGRNKHLLKLVSKFHKLAKIGHTWQTEARQQSLEDRSVSHEGCVSVLKLVPRCYTRRGCRKCGWNKSQVQGVARPLAGGCKGPRTRGIVGEHGAQETRGRSGFIKSRCLSEGLLRPTSAHWGGSGRGIVGLVK